MILLKALKQLKQRSPALFDSHGGALEFSLAKHGRALIANHISLIDLETVTLWRQEVGSYSHKNSSLEFLLQLFDKIMLEISSAFLKRVAILKKMPLEQLVALDHQLTRPQKNTDVNALKLQIACACHDLYWDFYSPIELVIDFSNFIELFRHARSGKWEGVTIADRDMLIPKVALLEGWQEWVISWGRGAAYQRLQHADALGNPSQSAALFAHKMGYLKKVQQAADHPAKVLIVGAGPGGLMRGIVTLLKGGEVVILEKRARYASRKNVVKIHYLPLLDYLGIAMFLLQEGKIDPIKTKFLRVVLGDLQRALQSVFSFLCPMKKAIQTATPLIDIEDKGEKIVWKAEHRGVVKWFEADYVVDASGANSVIATLLGNEGKILSKKNVMVGAFLTGIKRDFKLPEKYVQSSVAIKQLVLKTPRQCCLLVLPLCSYQQEIEMLNKQIQSLLKQGNPAAVAIVRGKRTRLIKKIAVQAINETIGCDEALKKIDHVWTFDVSLQMRHPGTVLKGCFIQQSGDAVALSDPLAAMGCTTALKGATIFSGTLDGNGIDEFVYATNLQSRYLLMRSFRSREEPIAKQLFNTWAWAFEKEDNQHNDADKAHDA